LYNAMLEDVVPQVCPSHSLREAAHIVA
jgi:hypothetical protein